MILNNKNDYNTMKQNKFTDTYFKEVIKYAFKVFCDPFAVTK